MTDFEQMVVDDILVWYLESGCGIHPSQHEAISKEYWKQTHGMSLD